MQWSIARGSHSRRYVDQTVGYVAAHHDAVGGGGFPHSEVWHQLPHGASLYAMVVGVFQKRVARGTVGEQYGIEPVV